jgi:1-acyl-sn-glycerol-3-phosphate acyltransferase
MELEEDKILISQKIDYEQLSESEAEKLKGDLEYDKTHQSVLYKLLKYNPIDILNDMYRKAIRELNLEDLEGKLQWWAATFYVKLLVRTLWNFKAEYPNRNMFPEFGPLVVISNHQSHIDPFLVGAACHRRIRFMSKLENFKTPIVRTLFTNLGAFKVDRENPEAGWERARQLIREGEVVGLFPEGTRSVDGELGEFRTGAVRLAIEMGCPIVPMAIIGSQNALPKGKLVMKPTQILVRVGDPRYYSDYDINNISYDEVRKLTNELREDITKLKDGTYGKTEQQLLEEGPDDIEKKMIFSFKRYLKDQGISILQTVDDIWYGFVRALEDIGVGDKFKETVQNFSGWLVQQWADLMLPSKVIDYDKYIPDSGAAVLCTNHNSEWDVIMTAQTMIYYRKRVIYQMAKQTLFKPPIVNAWIRNHHAFPLKRGQQDVDSYNYAKYLLDKGQIVMIYPEGTTNLGDGQLLEGHTGAIRLAIEKQVPILLIGITGTEKVYPKHAKMLNFYKGTIYKAGPPFMEHKQYWGKPMPGYEELKRLTNNMMAQLKELLFYDTPDI